MGLGMSSEQVVTTVERFPRILHSSANSLEAKIRFLTEDMGRSLDELVGYPSFISLSLPNRVRGLAWFCWIVLICRLVIPCVIPWVILICRLCC